MMLPTCARCGRPVDEVVRWDDPVTLDLVFVAVCHGAREVGRVSPRAFLLDDPRVSFGVAFADSATSSR